jgi:hypothetical protein
MSRLALGGRRDLVTPNTDGVMTSRGSAHQRSMDLTTCGSVARASRSYSSRRAARRVRGPRRGPTTGLPGAPSAAERAASHREIIVARGRRPQGSCCGADRRCCTRRRRHAAMTGYCVPCQALRSVVSAEYRRPGIMRRARPPRPQRDIHPRDAVRSLPQQDQTLASHARRWVLQPMRPAANH